MDEYGNCTEIKNVTSTTVNSSGNTMPQPSILSTLDCNSEDYEGVLIQTTGICDNENPDEPDNWGEWTINDGTGSVRIDDFGYLFEPVLNTEYLVTGVLHFKNGNYKIEPRDEFDIEIVNSQPEAPEITGIEIINSGSQIKILWDNQNFEYKIYSDVDPYGNFETLETTVSEIGEVIIPLTGNKRFFRITAE